MEYMVYIAFGGLIAAGLFTLLVVVLTDVIYHKKNKTLDTQLREIHKVVSKKQWNEMYDVIHSGKVEIYDYVNKYYNKFVLNGGN